MLGPGLRRQLGCVGRQKRERRLIIAAVLGEIEVHAADEMPRWALPLEKVLDRRLRFGKFGSKRGNDLGPERFKDRGRDVLGARHRRRGRGECFELVERRRRYWRAVRVQIRMRTDGRDEPRGKIAPVAEVRWKRGPDLGGAELEQAVTGATSERAFDAPRERGRRSEDVVCAREQQVAARSQRQRRHEARLSDRTSLTTAPSGRPSAIRGYRRSPWRWT